MKSLIEILVLGSISYCAASEDYVSFTYGITNDDCDRWSYSNRTKFEYNCMKLEDLLVDSPRGQNCFSEVILGHGKESGSLKGHSWNSELNKAAGRASSAVACQAQCQRTKNCGQFMWNKKTQMCSLRTFHETAMSLSTRVDDIISSTSSLPALSDPRWAACDLSLLNDCSTGRKSCVICEGHPRCLITTPKILSGPKYCSRYTPFNFCDLLPKTELSEEFFSEGKPAPRCAQSSGFDVLLLQEATSQSSYMTEFLSLASSTVKPLLESSPLNRAEGPLMMGHATFTDKPVAPFGDKNDYCFKLTQSLTVDNDLFAAALRSVKASGGGDSKNDQFGALVASASSHSVGWRDGSSRVIVLLTNSVSHRSTKETRQMFDISPRGTDFVDGQADQFCKRSDYSNIRDLRYALKMKHNHDVVFLTTFGAEFDYWKWINQYIGQTDDFVQVLDEDGSNMVAALSAGLSAVLKSCERDLVKHTSA